jgi:predicted ABC-type ATPase
MESKPTIYVLAGANGVGKTTINQFFIPKGVPYVNADDMAKQLRERLGNINVQEIANAQALDRMNDFIAQRVSFAIETNLADKETWQFLIGIQKLGYHLHLNFFGVSDVEICVNRVYNRVAQGGHFVLPDVVRMRYEAGLKLLKHFRAVPNRLVLTDNLTEGLNCAELSLGEVFSVHEPLPDWVKPIVFGQAEPPSEVMDIGQLRSKYQNMRGNLP